MRYSIICKECGAKRIVGLTEYAIDWLDNNPDPQATKIISARKRFDGQWGFQCICGNDDLWTAQEKRNVKSMVSVTPKEIADIVRILKPVIPKFEMVSA